MWAKRLTRDVRPRHGRILGGKRGDDVGILLGQQLGAADPARRQHPIAVPRGGAEHRLGMAGDVDRQRVLHRAGRDMGFRHLVVLAVVAEELPAEGQVEDVAELVGHFEILGDVDAEPLEFVGLIAGADAEHQSAIRQRVGGGDLGGEPSRVVQGQYHDRGAEPDPFGDRGAMRHHHQWRRAQAIIREMVLGEPGDRVAELVGQPRLLGDFAKHLRRRLVRFARPHQIEDPEIHRLISTLQPVIPTWLRYAPGVKGAPRLVRKAAGALSVRDYRRARDVTLVLLDEGLVDLLERELVGDHAPPRDTWSACAA